MSNLSLQLQAKSLTEAAKRKIFTKELVGFKYEVHPKVFKGSTDSELLCSVIKVMKNDDVWDIGTGTGLAALTAKKRGARYVLATDFNPYAVKNAKRNSKLLKLKIDVKKADVFGTIKKKFDLVTFNPPYTDNKATRIHEINFWDKDHRTVRKFFKDIKNHLKPDGRAIICWSSFGKTSILKKIAREHGFILRELSRKKGKRNLIYYAYQLKNAPQPSLPSKVRPFSFEKMTKF